MSQSVCIRITMIFNGNIHDLEVELPTRIVITCQKHYYMYEIKIKLCGQIVKLRGGEISTSPLCNIIMIFFMHVVITSPNHNVKVMTCHVLFYDIMTSYYVDTI